MGAPAIPVVYLLTQKTKTTRLLRPLDHFTRHHQGAPQMSLPMEGRGVDARANTWSGWKTSNRTWIGAGKIVILAQIQPTAPDLLVSGNRLRRPFATPPGVPADRIAILRQAFAATMTDSELMQDAAKLNVDMAPSVGLTFNVLSKRRRPFMQVLPSTPNHSLRTDGSSFKRWEARHGQGLEID